MYVVSYAQQAASDDGSCRRRLMRYFADTRCYYAMFGGSFTCCESSVETNITHVAKIIVVQTCMYVHIQYPN